MAGEKLDVKTCLGKCFAEHYSNGKALCDVFYFENHTAILFNLFTIPEYRKQGYAKDLVRTVQAEYKKEIAPLLIAGVQEDNYLADFFANLGFKQLYYADHLREIMMGYIRDEARPTISALARKSLVEDSDRVEIIMLKYKSPELESKAIESIIKYTNHPYKLTIYDNRLNTANTARIWNKLARESTCPYVCFIDSDTEVSEGWLDKMMQALNYGIYDVVVPRTDNCGTKQQMENQIGTKQVDFILSGFCFLVLKESLEQYLFDEEFYFYGQDSDWFDRLLVDGKKLAICYDAFVHHEASASGLKAEADGELDREADIRHSAELFSKKYNIRRRHET